ncbi:hypothetical protein ACLMAB_19590 [Brevibacillus laterosporus]
MHEKYTYYDWLTEQNLSSGQQSKLHIFLYLISDKLTGNLITAEYDKKYATMFQSLHIFLMLPQSLGSWCILP